MRPRLPRRRQALSALAPSMVAEIASSAAPDRALHHMASFITLVGARTSYLHLLLENPGIRRLLVRLFATSEFLSNFFLRHPELLDSLVRADLVQLTRTRADLARELAARLGAAEDFESELDTLRRFRTEEFLRIGVHDIQGELRPPGVSAQLSALADVCLAQALGLAWRDVTHRFELPPEAPTEGLAVVAMGKLGGAELNYHSDLDLIFVYDAGDAGWWRDRIAPHEFFTRVAQRAISMLQTPTREGVAYRIDTRLRPSGNQGPLVSSLEAFEAYHRTSAQLWERQALIKARPVEGPAALRQRLGADDHPFRLRPRPRSCRHRRDAPHARAHRGGAGRRRRAAREHQDRPRRAGRRGVRRADAPARARTSRVAAPRAVHAEGTDGARGERASRRGGRASAPRGIRLPARARGPLRIERDQPVEALDTEPEALRGVARRLGYTGSDDAVVAALRADHERHRDAIRAAYDRAFSAALGAP